MMRACESVRVLKRDGTPTWICSKGGGYGGLWEAVNELDGPEGWSHRAEAAGR